MGSTHAAIIWIGSLNLVCGCRIAPWMALLLSASQIRICIPENENTKTVFPGKWFQFLTQDQHYSTNCFRKFSSEKRLWPILWTEKPIHMHPYGACALDCRSSTLTQFLLNFAIGLASILTFFLFFSHFLSSGKCVVPLLFCSKFFCVNSSAKCYNMHGYLNANTTLYFR